MKNRFLILFLLLWIGSFSQIVVVTHKAYQIYFDVQLKQPLYTHYVLKKSMLNGKIKRGAFDKDNLIDSKLQGSAEDYLGNFGIYDKGHLVPFDDMALNQDTADESMVYTNVAPENSKLNKGTWKSLELHIRQIASKYDVEIWTGCFYEGSEKYVGKLKVPIYYWKLIKYNGKVEAYKMPNEVPKSKKINDYKTNIQELLKIVKP